MQACPRALAGWKLAASGEHSARRGSANTLTRHVERRKEGSASCGKMTRAEERVISSAGKTIPQGERTESCP